MWAISDVKKSDPSCLHICSNVGFVSEVSKKKIIIGCQCKCSHKGIKILLWLLFERLCFSPLFPSAPSYLGRSLSQPRLDYIHLCTDVSHFIIFTNDPTWFRIIGMVKV